MVGKVSGFTCFVTIHERERQTDGQRTTAGHAIHSAAQQQKKPTTYYTQLSYGHSVH